MQESLKVIERSKSKIDHVIFSQLNKLCMDYYWLQDESEALVELWNICDDQERILIKDLLNNFVFINSRELKNIGKKVADHITNQWKLDHKKTWLVAVSDNQEADGSQMFLQCIKDKFVDYGKWKESNFYNNLGFVAKWTKKKFRLILLDDFIGTGNTIERKVNWLRTKFEENGIENIELFIVAIAIMNFAHEKLDSLNVKYFSPNSLKKGISERLNGIEKDTATKIMKDLEKKLGARWNGKFVPKFGYQKSESLYAIEPYNIPNNVFPIFWWPVYNDYKKRKTIFKRLI